MSDSSGVVRGMSRFGFRLGATSFLHHDDYVPAVRATAPLCEDIALLIAETGAHCETLITQEAVRELAAIGQDHGVTFHIHLPTDAFCDTQAGINALEYRVLKTLERTAPLMPHTHVLHLDYQTLRATGRYPTPDSIHAVATMLCRIADALPDPASLALENLETFPTDFWDVWLEETPYSRCLDIGHVWKDGGEPDRLWQAWQKRVRQIHLHGIRSAEGRIKDHTSLHYLPLGKLDAALHPLWKAAFTGVVTLEVFSVPHFTQSCQALEASYARFQSRS